MISRNSLLLSIRWHNYLLIMLPTCINAVQHAPHRSRQTLLFYKASIKATAHPTGLQTIAALIILDQCDPRRMTTRYYNAYRHKICFSRSCKQGEANWRTDEHVEDKLFGQNNVQTCRDIILTTFCPPKSTRVLQITWSPAVKVRQAEQTFLCH